MEDTNHEWVKRLETVHHAAIAVSSAHDVETALQSIADSAREVAHAEMAAIGVPGAPGEPMAHFVVSGVSDELRAEGTHSPMGQGVLGVLLHGGQIVRVDDVTKHPAFKGYPDSHPPIRSFLGIPVRSNGDIIGDLYIANKIDAPTFTDDDQHLIEMLAAHAAVAVQSLRYYRQEQELAVIRAQARLAPQIEDTVLQTLYGAGLLLNTLDLTHPDHAAVQVHDVQQRLDTAIKHLREHLVRMTEPGNRS
jgi:GAF domain-containing protein